MRNFLIMVLFGCLLTGCASVSAKVYQISELPAKIDIFTGVGRQAQVILEENATTGYMWEAEKVDGLTVEIEHCAADSELCGAPGTAVVKVSAAKSGFYGVSLRYVRSWTPDEPAAKVRLRVIVAHAGSLSGK